MRIRAVETVPLRAQLPRVFRGSKYRMSTRCMALRTSRLARVASSRYATLRLRCTLLEFLDTLLGCAQHAVDGSRYL